MKKHAKLFVTLCLWSCLTACSTFGSGKKAEATKPDSAETLYEEATVQLQEENYAKAVAKFEELERTYPFSKLAIKAQVMRAYTQYQAEQYASAITAIDNFVKLHPGNKDVSYAYYLKALVYYEQISDVRRDQGMTEMAFKSLKEVIARFPNSEYARDAKIKLDLVKDHLAGKEIAVGRFYLGQGNYTAAINRFKHVVEKYQTTTHVPEAMHRLVESYLSLGVFNEAKRYAAVLGHNYPGNKWYERSYALLTKVAPAAQLADDGLQFPWLEKTWPFNKKKDNNAIIEGEVPTKTNETQGEGA